MSSEKVKPLEEYSDRYSSPVLKEPAAPRSLPANLAVFGGKDEKVTPVRSGTRPIDTTTPIRREPAGISFEERMRRYENQGGEKVIPLARKAALVTTPTKPK